MFRLNNLRLHHAVRVACLVLTVFGAVALPAYADTKFRMWGKTVRVASDDRVIMQVDGHTFRLPQDADLVPEQPLDQTAVFVIGASGELAHMARGPHIKLQSNASSLQKRNCFVYNEVGLPGFNIPAGLTQEDADYLQGCIVALITFGPGVASSRAFRQYEDWSDAHLETLSASPPRIVFPDVEATKQSVAQVQDMLFVGTAMDALYFLTRKNTGPDIAVLFDVDGPLFGLGRRLMECDGGFGDPPRIFGRSCRVAAVSQAQEAFIDQRVYCPCEQDLEGLVAIEQFAADRLGRFVGLGDAN